ncbi:MAG: TonB-dependent receptor [Pyrinomonadaceae bacterium]|nr:TonB-dependent receptor [Sphingobacteriaceae bacterium]
MKKCLTLHTALLITLFLSTRAFSQSTFQVQGFLIDKSTRDSLPNTLIKVNHQNYTITSYKGFYQLNLSSGIHHLEFILSGYDTLALDLEIKRNQNRNFWLERNTSLSEVLILSQKNGAAALGNTHVLTQKDLENVPSFMGQRDPLRVIKTLPGTGNAGEGNSGLYIRGGTTGQNHTILNNATIYNSSHLLGFFSVFNADAIDNITLYKSGIPAEFGGRLSSVIEVSSDKKIADSSSFKGDLSFIASDLSITAAISDNFSASLSARKTYMGVTLWPLMNKLNLGSKLFRKLVYDFSDLNFTSNLRLSKNDYLHLSAFTSGDDFGFGLQSAGIYNAMQWKNTAISLGWNTYLKSNLSVNTVLAFSGYNFNLDMLQENYEAGVSSKIKDFSLKSTADYALEKHQLKIGYQLTSYQLKPNTPYSRLGGTELDFGIPNIYNANEMSVFASDEIKVSEQLSIYAGGRFTYYQHRGPYTDINASGEEKTYLKNTTIRSFYYLEPSLLLKKSISPTASIKLSFTRNVQPLHLVSVTAINFPTDFWLPSLDRLPPEKGLQASIGYFVNSTNKKYESYIDVYYKTMKGITEYSGGIMNLLDNFKIEDRLLSGQGKAYGAEFFLKKNTGKLNGWIGYTWAKSTRNFPLIENNKTFSAKYDRRHDVSIVSNYHINPKWFVSGYFTYATGNTYTKPISRYILSGNVINEYGSFNGSRMPAYHRMDMAATYRMRTLQKFKSELTFSVYNVYNRQNPIFLYFVAKEGADKNSISVKPESIAILPVLPSLSYRFSF